jgi:hypothetical protein
LGESAALWSAIGNRYGQAATLRRLGHAQIRAGQADQARRSMAAALRLFDELGDHTQAAEVRAGVTEIVKELGSY